MVESLTWDYAVFVNMPYWCNEHWIVMMRSFRLFSVKETRMFQTEMLVMFHEWMRV